MDRVECVPVRRCGSLGQCRIPVTRPATAVLLLLLLAAAPALAQGPPAERPDLALGEQWLMKDGVYELTKIEKDRYVWTSKPGRQIYLTRDLALASVLKDRVWEWDVTPTPSLSWPLEAGKWSVKQRVILRMRSQSSGIPVRLEWRVNASEEVRVVGGLFKAYPIVYSAYLDSTDPFRGPLQVPGAQSWHVTTWYAPEARRIVKIQSSIDTLNFEIIGLDRPVVAAAPATPARPGTPPGAGAATLTPAPAPGHAPAAPSTAPAPTEAPPARTPAPSAAAPAPAPTPAPSPGATPTPTPPPASATAAPTPSPAPAPAITPPSPAPAPAQPPAARPGTPPAPAAAAIAIQWSHPEERARVNDESSVAAAVATSSQGVSEVIVILNGVQVFQQRERAPKKSVAIVAPIKLREGANTIVVRATAADGLVQQEVRTVTYERAAPAGPTPVRIAASRDRWAVVVGIGRYAAADIPALRYSVADAEAFAQFLVERGGFKKENVLLLTDKTEKKPTLRDMKWALGTFLARSAKKEDLVVIFYAGHGAPEVDPRGSEPDGLAKYLVPIDADPNDLYATALPMDELSIIFDRIEAERVVVFLDACYSGAAGGRTFASRRTRALRVDDVFLDRLARSRGRAIVTASRASEVSIELPELGHGLFTHYLLQGLRGAADLDRDGVVALGELYTYLEQQVTQKSRLTGGNQHPVMKGDMEGVLPLVKLGGR